MRDFTLEQYRVLLQALRKAGYRLLPLEEYCAEKEALDSGNAKFVILRHDVDKRADRSVQTAAVERDMGVRASYYFRVVPESNQPDVIRKITAMGHEIGYHYEDMACAKGDTEKAIQHFAHWLAYFREYYPVKTICMHGAPTSKWDGRDLWKRYDYHAYGIAGEPYFDVDFSRVFYLTDTGRCWDGYKVSIRDKVPVYQDEWVRKGWAYHGTEDVMKAIEAGSMPPKIMVTTHPQRWTDETGGWLKELLWQSAKNVVKRIVVATKM